MGPDELNSSIAVTIVLGTAAVIAFQRVSSYFKEEMYETTLGIAEAIEPYSTKAA